MGVFASFPHLVFQPDDEQPTAMTKEGPSLIVSWGFLAASVRKWTLGNDFYLRLPVVVRPSFGVETVHLEDSEHKDRASNKWVT